MGFGAVRFYRRKNDVILLLVQSCNTVVIYVFSLFPGDVVLENLILKQNALEELNIPVQTVYGHLGLYCGFISFLNIIVLINEAANKWIFLAVK